MDADTVVMSEKGQIVIPGKIRKRMGASKGTLFAVMGNKDTVVMRRMNTPTREELLRELKSLAHEIAQELKSHGITEDDVIRIAVRSRGKGHEART